MTSSRLSIFVLIIVSLFGANSCHQGGEEGLPPCVELAGDKVFKVELGGSITIAPSFSNLTDDTIIRWTSNSKLLGTSTTYTFPADEAGVFYIPVEVTNQWGTGFVEMRIDVYAPTPEPPKPPEPAPEAVNVSFERSEFHVAQGRTIRIMPLDVDSTKSYAFTWTLDGATVQEGSEPLYRFEAAAQGRFSVGLRMEESGRTVLDTALTVVVCPPQGAWFRPASGSSSPSVEKVYEFLPAPGQYVNENYTATTMEEACAYALGRIRDSVYVSLGGFGGSIVVGFDHSIRNSGSYDFAIKNNIYSNYSEPGIVWVMQDEDGNGLPDDTWYELKGSEYGLDCTVQDYAVTYYRPEAPGQPVAWTDNRGGSGSIDYLVAYHRQDYYYPLWVKEDRYTLRGTRLEARNYDQSGRGVYWINPDYGWGYADNYSETDMQPGGKEGATAGCNHFKISDAVTFDGKPAGLDYIDFVKVQTGLNSKSGWLGEISTEVTDVIDFNLVK